MFENGLGNGVFSIIMNLENGEVHRFTPTYVMSVAQPVPGAEIREDGSYDASKCEYCDGSYVSSGQKEGIILGLGL